MPMKESKYNQYFTADDGTKLVFNSYSCGLAVVDNSYTKLIDNVETLSKNNIPDDLQECFNNAYDGHFIVESDCNESQELLIKRAYHQYDTSSLSLTIAPTLDCNFKCIYCYESSKHGIMSDRVYDSIINFVEQQAPHIKNLAIHWYGGEPLMAKNIVYRLSDKFIEICHRHNIQYVAAMVSNGSLLNNDVIERLIQYHIKNIQITIDGPPEIHNKRRVNKQGVGTFELLISNINKLLTNNIDVVIRINVDKTNDESIEKLIALLSDKLVSKNVYISFGQVVANTEACRSVESNCYQNEEFANQLLIYYNLLEKYGFSKYNKLPYPQPKFVYCCAEAVNSFVIDHEGYLYKCWNDVGLINHSVGNLTNGTYDITCYKNSNWLCRNPIESEECKKCNLLPICMGGCPFNKIRLNQSNKCDLIKYNIENTVMKYYNLSNDKQDL